MVWENIYMCVCVCFIEIYLYILIATRGLYISGVWLTNALWVFNGGVEEIWESVWNTHIRYMHILFIKWKHIQNTNSL